MVLGLPAHPFLLAHPSSAGATQKCIKSFRAHSLPAMLPCQSDPKRQPLLVQLAKLTGFTLVRAIPAANGPGASGPGANGAGPKLRAKTPHPIRAGQPNSIVGLPNSIVGPPSGALISFLHSSASCSSLHTTAKPGREAGRQADRRSRPESKVAYPGLFGECNAGVQERL